VVVVTGAAMEGAPSGAVDTRATSGGGAVSDPPAAK
jgi:hypothetical protein